MPAAQEIACDVSRYHHVGAAALASSRYSMKISLLAVQPTTARTFSPGETRLVSHLAAELGSSAFVPENAGRNRRPAHPCLYRNNLSRSDL